MSMAPPTVLRLALPLPVPQLFDYLPPLHQQADAGWIGCRVRVPFGTRALVGVVADVGPGDPLAPALRAAEARLDDETLFDAELWRSLGWAADYYARPLGEVLSAALPAPLRQGEPLPAPPATLYWRLNPAGEAGRSRLRAASRPARLAELLATQPRDEHALAAFDPDWRAALRALRRRAWVEGEAHLDPPVAAAVRGTAPALNPGQQEAVRAVVEELGGFKPLLLDGVTGSGKTEVYLQAIAACLQRGRQALVLVPEIGLTPQALQRYGERFTTPVLALHSGLSDPQRAQAWQAMRSGRGRLLIGTRSAIFTPLPEAGLIVVDEEHDASYKQQDGFRYHARDLALVRGKALGVPVLLGSATPALESLQQARSGRSRRLRLPARAGGAQAPRFHVVDVRSLPLRDGLSAPLREALRACLERGEQALVFRNRRGYAPCLLCHDCGWNARCERCEAALTLHGRRSLRCHHCGAAGVAPPACPQCGGLGLVPQGAGTERLEEALAAAFPGVPLVRVDRETTRHRDALERHFARLGDAPGILVGTQMLAKGHDLPRLTTVAIASIDEGLFSADFRAPERLAQLLLQVAGRAGRAERPGAVWLQTHHPEHPLLRTLIGAGYHAFAELALAEREAAGFPPFTHLALLRAEAHRAVELDAFLAAAHACVPALAGVEAHPPMPAPMALRAGRLRGQILLVAAQRPARQRVLRSWMAALRGLREARRVRWSVDVDPIDLY
jgi:primosomal protein N' (replication factor Y)